MPTFDGREAYSFSTTSPGQAPVGVWAAAGIPTNAPLIQTRNATGGIVTTINADGEVVAPKATITTLVATDSTFTTSTIGTATITTLSGTPSLPTGATAITQAGGNSSTAIATTAFVASAISTKLDATALYAPVSFMSTPILTPLLTAGAFTATVLVTDLTYFQYVGRIYKSFSSCTVVCYLLTTYIAGASATPWGEVSIWTGPQGYVTGGIPSSVSLRGASTTQIGTPGSGFQTVAPARITVNFPLTGVNAGDDIWLAFGSKGDTPAQFAGLNLDLAGNGFSFVGDGSEGYKGASSGMTNPASIVHLAANTTVSPVYALVYFA